jgi:transglutaminase superfamily protein
VLSAFDARERKILRRLTHPARIQRFLDEEIGYNQEPRGYTCYSPRMVLREGVAHCMEGAALAALALRHLGYPALLVDLEAVRDSDHVLAVYRAHGHWGAVAKSDYTGLRSREPVYKTVRELALSYFEGYYNPKGEKTLRAFSKPVNLARFDRGISWMTTFDEIWAIPEHLCEIPHTTILTQPMEKQLARTDRRLYDAGRVGGVCEPLFNGTYHRTYGGATQTASRRPRR